MPHKSTVRIDQPEPTPLAPLPLTYALADAIKAGGEKAENILFTACSEKPHGAGIDIIVYPPGIRYVGLTGEQLVEFVKTQLCEGKVAENLKTEPLRTLQRTHSSSSRRMNAPRT